jgi:hypothetical protein
MNKILDNIKMNLSSLAILIVGFLAIYFIKMNLPSLAILISGFVTIYFFVRFAPKFDLRIIPEWIDKQEKKIVFRFEIENKSQVRINVKQILVNHKFESLMIRLQILEYDKNKTPTLSEFVPFTRESIRENENPLEWKEPEKICQTTRHIYPGEVVRVDRLYTFSEDKIWHIGFQIQTEYNWIENLFGLRKLGKSWTTTKIFCFDVQDNQAAHNQEA